MAERSDRWIVEVSRGDLSHVVSGRTGHARSGDVRAAKYAGAPLPWAEPYQQEMTTRIIDVAHTVATYRTSPGPHQDLSAARQAVTTGLDVDHTAELLYRDWCRLEHTDAGLLERWWGPNRHQTRVEKLDVSIAPTTAPTGTRTRGGTR